MYKAFVLLVFLILLTGSSGRTIGQVTRSGASSIQTNAEAERLLKEGLKLTGLGLLPEAVSALEEAVRLDPHYAQAYAALGRAYFKMREWQRAADNLHHAIALKAKQQQVESAPPQQAAAPNAPANAVQMAAASNPTPSGQTVTAGASTQPQKEPDADTTRTSTATVEVKQQTSPEVKQDEETTRELSPLKIDPTTTAQEKQEPTGVSIAISASPISSTIESRDVTPIPLKRSNEDISLTKVYRVGPNDVLDVRINEAQQQSTLFTVTSAGLLEHPMLADPLRVSALTTEEIEISIHDDLKKRALIEDPKVTVTVRDYASHTILVRGLVRDTGTRILRSEAIPLYVVVADVQPLPEAARATVMRNELNQTFEIDLTDVAEMNLLVRPGDVIDLGPNETQFIYVGGEVKNPGEKIFRRGLTLTQAIISAGGVTLKSRAAEIGRDDGRGLLVTTIFKLDDIETGKAIDPLIKPGDRIMILR
jgi:protein involved in polysaccharide export with SLBB domain